MCFHHLCVLHAVPGGGAALICEHQQLRREWCLPIPRFPWTGWCSPPSPSWSSSSLQMDIIYHMHPLQSLLRGWFGDLGFHFIVIMSSAWCEVVYDSKLQVLVTLVHWSDSFGFVLFILLIKSKWLNWNLPLQTFSSGNGSFGCSWKSERFVTSYCIQCCSAGNNTVYMWGFKEGYRTQFVSFPLKDPHCFSPVIQFAK